AGTARRGAAQQAGRRARTLAIGRAEQVAEDRQVAQQAAAAGRAGVTGAGAPARPGAAAGAGAQRAGERAAREGGAQLLELARLERLAQLAAGLAAEQAALDGVAGGGALAAD